MDETVAFASCLALCRANGRVPVRMPVMGTPFSTHTPLVLMILMIRRWWAVGGVEGASDGTSGTTRTEVLPMRVEGGGPLLLWSSLPPNPSNRIPLANAHEENNEGRARVVEF
jgi:hypothetical protein